MGKELNRHFPQRIYTNDQKHMRRWSTSLIIRQTQIKTTVRYHIIATNMDIIKNTENTGVRVNVEKL